LEAVDAPGHQSAKTFYAKGECPVSADLAWMLQLPNPVGRAGR
jgi:hypothetical protein